MTTTIQIVSIILNIYTIIHYIWKKTHKTMEKQEELILTFSRGRDSRTVARTSEGKICLLDIPYCKENHIYVKQDEDWRCAIKEVKQNAIIVQPITRIVTAQENAVILDGKINELVCKYKAV